MTDSSPSPSPLSNSLQELLATGAAGAALTPNEILRQTRGRGLYLLMVLLCLPFLVPVSIPGVSSFSGGVVMLMALRLACRLPPRLPRWIGEVQMSPEHQRRWLSASVRVLHFLENYVKPRGSGWLEWPLTQLIHCLLLALMGFLLALPLLVPFTNTFPAYAIVLLALSMMETDGRTIWLGYAVVLATLVYFGLMAEGLKVLVGKFFGG